MKYSHTIITTIILSNTKNFASKRKMNSLKLVLLLDNHLQNQRHFCTKFGLGISKSQQTKGVRVMERERGKAKLVQTQLFKIIGWYLNLEHRKFCAEAR